MGNVAMTDESTTDLSITGLADSLDRIADGILEATKPLEEGSPAEVALMKVYDVISTEVSNLRDDENDDSDDDDED